MTRRPHPSSTQEATAADVTAPRARGRGRAAGSAASPAEARTAPPVKGAVAGSGEPPRTPPAPRTAPVRDDATSDTTPESPGARAARYARDVLKVDAVYVEALELAGELEAAQRELVELSRTRRDEAERLEEYEADLAAEERAKPTDMAATVFEKHIRTLVVRDTKARELRARIREVTSRHEQAEFNVRLIERRLAIRTSRMEELSGLLHYYAAVRTDSATQTAHTKPTEMRDSDD